jgi:hypothetical protein
VVPSEKDGEGIFVPRTQAFQQPNLVVARCASARWSWPLHRCFRGMEPRGNFEISVTVIAAAGL